MITAITTVLHPIMELAYRNTSAVAADDANWSGEVIGIGVLFCCPLVVGVALIIVTMTIWRRRSR